MLLIRSGADRHRLMLALRRMSQRIHHLHIRKTGGNAVQAALRLYSSADLQFVFHPHETTLQEIPDGEKVCFMLRDPVDRFVSGFNSRRRRGRPLRNIAWDERETLAFAEFSTPDQLATSLSSSNQVVREKAATAMYGINHVKTRYSDWLRDVSYVNARRGDILWVGLTSRLSDDFERLKRLLSLPKECHLPADPVVAHRRLHSDPVHLSEPAVDNLKSWYSSDYEFLEYFFGVDSQRRSQ